jgi:hypothetical protein
MKIRVGLCILILLVCGKFARADSASLFDPARHMHVSEVRAGMVGYGLSVFQGSKIEKFDIEVVSILHNFNPQGDVVLIRCKGDYLAHTGAIAGMSGSPIYLKDDEGHYRMIGAFAYGWPLAKDPLAGVQPIEYMLKLPTNIVPATPGIDDKPVSRRIDRDGPTWSLAAAGYLPIAARTGGQDSLQQQPAGQSSTAPQLSPLATPLMVGGCSPKMLSCSAAMFKRFGMVALQAGGGGSPSNMDPLVAKIEPGGVLAVPLLTGDVDLTAIGTVTEVIGDRIFGFGHPFNNEGAIALPMGTGQINGIIPTLQTSFKLGALSQNLGRLTTDESVGVAGRLAESAPTVPIDFHVEYAGDIPPRDFHFRSALHSKFTPMIAAMALGAAVTGPSELPQYNTLDYELKLEFANGQELEFDDTVANAAGPELIQQVALPLMAASENPFARVSVKSISGTIKISSQVRQAQILEVNLPRSRFRPGDSVNAFITYKPFREPSGILPVELDLPRDLPAGTYQLIISDATRFFQDEQQAEPFRFNAQNADEVFGVLRDAGKIRQNAVYLRLLRQPDGVAVGRTALSQLPSSRRQILLGAGRSNITPFVSSNTKIIATDRVMVGSAEFEITIDPRATLQATNRPQAAANPVGAAGGL